MGTSDEEDKDARFLPEIRRLQELGFSPYKVWRTLRPDGLSRSRDAFRKWCLKLINAKIIPPWPQPDNRGRPKGKLKCSLGLLDDREQGNDRGLSALGILVPESPIPKNLQVLLFNGYDLDIPLAHDDEPDYSGYAKKLGWRRVQSFGDLDYYFLARWTREIREMVVTNASEVLELNRRALQKAREIRSQMIDAVKPKRRRPRKK